MPRRAQLALVLALFCAAACGGSEPIASPATGRRVVTLSPSLTRTVLALGAREELVAVDRFSAELPEVNGLPSLGGVFNPDLERAVELAPSLVLAVASAEQNGFFRQLRARGVRVEEFEVYTLDEVLESFRRVGRYLERSAQAEALVAGLERELEGVRAAVASRARRSVAIVLERDPLYVVGGGAFLDELIEIAGGRNVFSELQAPYPQVSLEALADRAPDLILDTYVESGSPAAEEDLRGYWSRFAWVNEAQSFPFGATHPAPNLADTARLLLARLHAEAAR